MEWILIRRKVRGESHKRGTIIKHFPTESAAKSYRAWCLTTPGSAGYDYWVMRESEY